MICGGIIQILFGKGEFTFYFKILANIMNLTKKYNINNNNKTKKNTKQYFSKINITSVNDIIKKKDSIKLASLISQYFTKEILPIVNKCKRPINIKYNDFVERSKGRFEILPSKKVLRQIFQILNSNKKFRILNEKIKNTIKHFWGDVTEELGILPLEPDTAEGKWHRDIFVKSKNDFDKNVFYITQVIYLDDKADTEFCVNSQNNSDNNDEKYKKKHVHSKKCSSIFFDGRTIHRGLENESDKVRYAIYISYYKKTYIDNESQIDKNFNEKDLLSVCNQSYKE